MNRCSMCTFITSVVLGLFMVFAIGSTGIAATSCSGTTTLSCADGSILDVPVGEARVLLVPGLTRVAISEPSVADVATLSADEILVVGHKVGHVNAIIWANGVRRSVAVNVIPDLAPAKLAIRAAYGELPVELAIAGDALVLKGTVTSETVKTGVEQVVKALGHPVVNLLQVTGKMYKPIEIVRGTAIETTLDVAK